MADSIETSGSKTKPAKSVRIRRILDDFTMYKNHRMKTWEKIARKCAKFYYGDQWSAENKAELERKRRPPSVFNEVLPVIDAIVGHQLQNRVDTVAKPVDRFGDVILADIITSVIKSIEWQNNTSLESRFQFLDGLITAVGVQELWYENDLELQGMIRCEQKSPWHYYLDPSFEKYDYRDAHKLFKETWMTRAEIKLNYGETVAKQVHSPADEEGEFPERNVPSSSDNNGDYGSRTLPLFDDEETGEFMRRGYDVKNGRYRVIEQYEKKYERVELTLDPTTSQWTQTDKLPPEATILTETKSVSVIRGYIALTTVISDTVIAQESDIRSKKNESVEFYYLFNFYFPYFMNGKYWGVIENLIYPQEDINKHYSQIMTILNSYAATGIYHEEGAMPPETEEVLDELLSQPSAHIKLSEGGITKIKEITRHEAPQTLFTLVGQKGELTRYIASTPQEFQGDSKRAQSGKAKESQIGQAAMKLQGLIENFRESQRLRGKAYIWWVQNFYTSERLVRILGDEYGQQDESLQLNMQFFDQIINDVTIGKYDVTLAYEAVTQSERDRIKYRLIEIANANPQFADIIGKYELQYEDIPQKEKIMAEWEARQQALQQQAQMMGAPPGGQPNTGPIQSAPRPSRGPRRMPQGVPG